MLSQARNFSQRHYELATGAPLILSGIEAAADWLEVPKKRHAEW